MRYSPTAIQSNSSAAKLNKKIKVKLQNSFMIGEWVDRESKQWPIMWSQKEFSAIVPIIRDLPD